MLHFPTDIILASASPRRQQLLREAGFSFTVIVKEIDESWPEGLIREQVAEHIAKNKASAYDKEVKEGKTVVTADTIVCIGNEILNKAPGIKEATEMLEKLSGKKHEVITAVCIRNKSSNDCFHVTTSVTFRNLSAGEIEYYIETCKPFDKAGAYGIQEWIGLVAITSINGSYHNVVGLPVAEVYRRLMLMHSK
jgi:septum formation protein